MGLWGGDSVRVSLKSCPSDMAVNLMRSIFDFKKNTNTSIHVINHYRILSLQSHCEQGQARSNAVVVFVCGHEEVFYQPAALLSPSKRSKTNFEQRWWPVSFIQHRSPNFRAESQGPGGSWTLHPPPPPPELQGITSNCNSHVSSLSPFHADFSELFAVSPPSFLDELFNTRNTPGQSTIWLCPATTILVIFETTHPWFQTQV